MREVNLFVNLKWSWGLFSAKLEYISLILLTITRVGRCHKVLRAQGLTSPCPAVVLELRRQRVGAR